MFYFDKPCLLEPPPYTLHKKPAQVLQAEEASLSLWLDFAKAYLSQGQLQQCLSILEAGTSEEVRPRPPAAAVVREHESTRGCHHVVGFQAGEPLHLRLKV